MPAKIRVMTWNIEEFEFNAVSPDFAYITQAITTMNPDILVITEVMTGLPSGSDYGPPPAAGTPPAAIALLGRLVAGGGFKAVMNLQTILAKNYSLVPPRNLSNNDVFGHSVLMANEAIAVFYRQDRLQFLGPAVNINQNGNSQPGSLANIATAPNVDYPGNWPKALPATQVTPPGSGVALPQNQLSGQLVEYLKGQERHAFYTLFGFGSAPNPPQALIQLFSAHFSLNKDPKLLLDAIGKTLTGFPAQSVPVVTLVAGDFNAPIAPAFEAADYCVALDMNRYATPDDKLRQATNLVSKLTPLSTLLDKGYPGYGYLQACQTDNIAAYPAKYVSNFTTYIANPLMGCAASTAACRTPGGYFTTVFTASIDLDNYIYKPSLNLNMRDPKTRKESDYIGGNLISKFKDNPRFKAVFLEQFKKARSVSDHLPLMAEFTIEGV